MDRNTIDWKGYIPAITTPFLENGQIDWEGWKELLNWLVDEGMHGILINGSTGEWFSQSVEEQKELYNAAVKHINGRIPIIAGCTAYTVDQVVDLADEATNAGVSGILVAAPPYVVPNEKELYEFYKEISDRIRVPLVIYNWPRGTNIDMSIDLMKHLSDLDKVVAIKNSTGDFGKFVTAFFELKEKIRYFGFPMNKLGYRLAKDYNGDGTMGAGAILGRVHPNFYNYMWEDNEGKALNSGAKDVYLFQSFFNSDFSAKFGSPQSITKAALNLKGLPGGYPRSPILPLTEDEKQQVKIILEKVEE